MELPALIGAVCGKGPWVIQMSARSAAQGRGIRGRWTFQVCRFSWCGSPEYVSTIPGVGQSGPAADVSGGGRVQLGFGDLNLVCTGGNGSGCQGNGQLRKTSISETWALGRGVLV